MRHQRGDAASQERHGRDPELAGDVEREAHQHRGEDARDGRHARPRRAGEPRED